MYLAATLYIYNSVIPKFKYAFDPNFQIKDFKLQNLQKFLNLGDRYQYLPEQEKTRFYYYLLGKLLSKTKTLQTFKNLLFKFQYK